MFLCSLILETQKHFFEFQSIFLTVDQNIVFVQAYFPIKNAHTQAILHSN